MHKRVGSQGMHSFANILLEFACRKIINAHYTAGKLCSLIGFDLVPWSINFAQETLILVLMKIMLVNLRLFLVYYVVKPALLLQH